jgi:ABC-type glutathione transport system ATPase component
VARLIDPTAGSVMLDGRDLVALRPRSLRAVRREIQMVFQDPQTSLDPRWRIGRSVAEPLLASRIGTRASRTAIVGDLLERVGLTADHADRYPHELSIGQQQRVAIARALAPSPRVLVCDEPVAALDPSVQAQIVALLRDVMAERGLALLLVTHQLAVAAQLCETTTVLDAGAVVESGPTRLIVSEPLHTRTAAIVAAARRLEIR